MLDSVHDLKKICNMSFLVRMILLFSLPLSTVMADDDFLLLIPSIVAGSSSSSPSNNPSTTKPGPNNTGPKGTLTALNSGITADQNGQVIENLDIDGCITVRANNVIIRNVRVDCGGFYAIRIDSDYVGTLIEDVELINMKSAGVLGSDFILRRANIHDSGSDAVKPYRNAVIERSWFHRLGTIEGSHSDGVQMVLGGNVIIRENNIDMPHDLSGFTNSQCMIIQTNNGPIDNVQITNNWLNGGGYCIQINDKGNGHGAPTNVTIANNIFGPDCQFGTILVRGGGSNTVVENNIFELTRQIIGEQIDNTICGNDF